MSHFYNVMSYEDCARAICVQCDKTYAIDMDAVDDPVTCEFFCPKCDQGLRMPSQAISIPNARTRQRTMPSFFKNNNNNNNRVAQETK